MAWVIDNGARYGADDTGVRLVGGSSGAQLVSLAGPQINASRPGAIRSIVAMSGPMDFVVIVQENLTLSARERTGKSIPVYLGCRLADCTDQQMRAASPVHNISATSPPFLIINSDAEIVPVEQAQALHEALSAAGRPSTLRIVPGQDHGLVLLDSVEDDVVAFLRA